MASGKRCHYEVLGVSRESTADEIRSAYRKLALQLHPDKLIQSGLSQTEATSKFQELSHAYEVLSDPKERAWYDSHRSQILFSDPGAARDSFVPDLFSYFSNTVFSGYGPTGKGFYKVYSDVFDRVYANEVSFVRKLGLGMEKLREAPVMGNLESPYEQVTAFYNYWLGFSTVMDFCWVDRYDAGAGVNRKSRRVMEEENNKLRRKARREYNDTVRGLAEFVKKRDKRVIDMMVQRSKEAERKKEEEKERKKRLAREKMERARRYKEPEWARIEEEEIEGFDEEGEVEDGGKKSGKGTELEELYCVVCGKKFKSEKQWKNHEQSKKHKDKVAELRQSFKKEDVDEDEDEEEEGKDTDVFDEYELGKNEGVDPNVDEIEERLKEGFRMGEEESVIGDLKSEDGEDEFLDAEDGDSGGRAGEEDVNFDKVDGEDKDEEMSVLEAMLSGRKSWKTRGSRHMVEDIGGEVYVEIKNQEADDLQYDSRKSRGRRNKKERGRNDDKEDVEGDNDGGKSQNEETKEHDDETLEESSSRSFVEDENSVKRSANLRKNHKSSNISVDRKESLKKETNARSKNSTKGKKGKTASKDSGNVCQTCGEEFDSRNKLHKHLGNTGHASLKY